MKPTTINGFVNTTIHPAVRAALADATAEDIEEALETIADDIKSTRNKGVI